MSVNKISSIFASDVFSQKRSSEAMLWNQRLIAIYDKKDEVDVAKIKDKVSISNEGVELANTYDWRNHPHYWGAPDLYEVPELESPIEHTTAKGNRFVFETVKDEKEKNVLVVNVTTASGDDARVVLTGDTIISEDEDGTLRIDSFNGEGTNDNDIIINFSSASLQPKIDAKEGDDFVLSLGNIFDTSKGHFDNTGMDSFYYEKDENGKDQCVGIYTNAVTNINTGEGNDTVYVVGTEDETINISTGSGDDTVVAKTAGEEADSKGLNLRVESGSGDDNISVSTLNEGSILSGSGDDTVSVANMIRSEISSGSGDDTVSVSNMSKSRIFSGAGDDGLELGDIADSYLTTGSGDNTVTVLGAMENVEFDFFGGDVDFDMQGAAQDVKFFHLSMKTACSVYEAADNARLDFVAGALKGYDLNIGLNLLEHTKAFEEDVKHADEFRIKIDTLMKKLMRPTP